MTELRENLVSDKPPLTSLILVIAVALMGFLIVGPMIGFALAMPFYEGDFLLDYTNGTLKENAYLPLMIVQGCATFIGLVILPVLYVRFSQYKPIHRFFKSENNFPLVTLFICLIVVAFVIAISPITKWNMELEFPETLKNLNDWLRTQENKAAELTALITNFKSFGDFLLAFLVIAIFAALGEEFVFRGLIQNELLRGSKNIHVAIWLSAILFSAFHLQFFGFLPRMLLGVLFGYLYYWSGNLWIPIIAHFLNNGIIVTMFYLHSLSTSNIALEDETSAPFSLVAVCVVAVFALLYFFKRQYSVPEQLS
jgi:membrane protease YdiL (CAAX protease family)